MIYSKNIPVNKLGHKCVVLAAVLIYLNSQQAIATCSQSVTKMLDAPIEELLETPISVASNVSLDSNKQPASVTVISREQLQLSSARTLNEALMTYVPGYFMVEGQSDTVGAFRGLVGDSNAKIMMLINGHNINAERYGGMPDGIINGNNFDWIERIEVVRGPGSVTLGQGALQGVVNIITRTADHVAPECGDAKASLLGGGGLNNAWQGGMEAAFNHEDTDGYVFVQQKNYEGQPLRHQGFPERSEFIGDSLPLAGKDVISNIGHHLKGAENLSLFSHLRYKQLSVDMLHVEQQRDMYFFMRDSDGNKEELTYFGLNHDLDFTKNVRLESKLDAAIDDAGFYTVQTNSTAGGNRELRYGIKEILHLNRLWEGNNLALGLETHFYEVGLPNSNGENFIINNFSLLRGETVDTLNKKYTFVFPSNINIYSFFIEDNYQINSWLTAFSGIRFDEHKYWGDHFSPRVGAFITPWQDGQFRLSYQEGFRGAVGLAHSGGYVGDGFLSLPNLSKLGSAIPESGYNNPSTLKPETLKTLELAFNQHFYKYWQFSNVLFYSKASQLIDVGFIEGNKLGVTLPPIGAIIPSDNSYWFYINKAGNSQQIGFETSLNYTRDAFNITASHSFVDSLNYTSDFSAHALPLPAISQNVSRLNMLFKPWKNVTFGVNYLFYAPWNAQATTQGAHLLNASVMYAPWKNVELTLSAKNLLNENNLYPMLTDIAVKQNPGGPALESTTFWLNFRLHIDENLMR